MYYYTFLCYHPVTLRNNSAAVEAGALHQLVRGVGNCTALAPPVAESDASRLVLPAGSKGTARPELGPGPAELKSLGCCHALGGVELKALEQIDRRRISYHPAVTSGNGTQYSRLPHNPYPIKCILLDKSHKFEQVENFAFAKSLALFMVGIISAPYFAGTHFAGRSEPIWVMRESTVLALSRSQTSKYVLEQWPLTCQCQHHPDPCVI